MNDVWTVVLWSYDPIYFLNFHLCHNTFGNFEFKINSFILRYVPIIIDCKRYTRDMTGSTKWTYPWNLRVLSPCHVINRGIRSVRSEEWGETDLDKIFVWRTRGGHQYLGLVTTTTTTVMFDFLGDVVTSGDGEQWTPMLDWRRDQCTGPRKNNGDSILYVNLNETQVKTHYLFTSVSFRSTLTGDWLPFVFNHLFE